MKERAGFSKTEMPAKKNSVVYRIEEEYFTYENG